MSNVQERYNPRAVGVNATARINDQSIGGFLAVTAGTLTLDIFNSVTGVQQNLFTALPVSAGVYTPLPFYVGANGCVITLGGGASGVVAV